MDFAYTSVTMVVLPLPSPFERLSATLAARSALRRSSPWPTLHPG
ncbi:MAG TPA: hypothetical protein VIY28_08315 [Pseudonocardiaceae bacterium]